MELLTTTKKSDFSRNAVLSTKLSAPERDAFKQLAQQRGYSSCGLLKQLALEALETNK